MRFVSLLRGIVTTALSWGFVCAPLSLLPFIVAAFSGVPIPPGLFVAIMLSQGVMGAINGAVFAGLLAIAGRRRTFESLSMPFFAGLGAVGGVLFPFATRAAWLISADVAWPVSAMIFSVATSAALGAGCAALTLSIARRAPALPEGERPPAAALTTP